MASLTGKVSTAAAKVTTTWGDAGEVAVGALDGMLLTAESVSKTVEMHRDEPIATPHINNIVAGNVSVEGSLSGELRYENWDLFLALVMGADTVTQPDIPNSPSIYDHVFSLVSDVLGQYATLVFDKVTRIHVVPSATATGLTISGDSGGVLTIEIPILGNDRIYNSTINQAAQIAAVTYKTVLNTIPFNIGVFRLNTASGGALGAGDVLRPNSFSLSVEIPLEGDQTASGDDQIEQPDYTGIPVYKLTFGFPRVLSTLPAFVSLLAAETEMKGDITYTGPIANPGETAELNYSLIVEMPRMKLLNADELIEGVGKIPVTAEFELMKAATAPTGMTITNPLEITMRNTDSRDHIA